MREREGGERERTRKREEERDSTVNKIKEKIDSDLIW
jgi:hypothetical protein